MRRLAAALVLLAVSGTSARGQAPYSVRWGDAASVVAAGVVALIPEATKLPKSGPSCGSTAPCDPASLPGIDRSALHTFSGSASTTSTVLLAGVIGFAGLTSFDGATAAQRRGHVAVFANSLAWTLAATDWMKVLVRRKRPVLYTADATAAAADPNSQRSFPSGHASVAFAAATTYLVMAQRERLPHRGRNVALLYAGAGGIYRWVRRAFGPLHGFVAGWGYWVNNLFYFPSLLVTTAAIGAYAAGPRFVHLGEDNLFIALVSLAGLWLAVGMNVVGLRVGKRLQDLGGHGTWLPGLIFVVLAIWSLTTHGSATPVTARGLVPASLDLQSINLFATMTFAFAGLELAPTLGDEIHDPARTLRRGIAVSGLAIVGMYVLGTAAMLVSLPHQTVSITNGMPQATAALVERLGAGWLAPVAGIVAVLLVLGNLGGVGAWLAGSARLPYVAGVDGALPAVFGRIHPRWQTPYVGLLVQGAIATVFVIASLVGTTVRNAYLVLTQTTLILFFIPYLYLFLAYLRLRRQRTVTTALAGLVGSAAVLFSIVLGFVTPADEASPWLYRGKVIGGVVGFVLLGVLLAGRRVRHDTAPPASPA